MPEIRDYNLPWFEMAERLIGTQEDTSYRSNPKIMQWAKDIGGWVASYYKDDSIPWCGLFVAHCFSSVGVDFEIKNPLSALAWNQFGVKCEPCPGAVMVFTRSGGGHVGFYVSEDDTTFHILGGNQSDSVNITKVAKARFVGARWPKDLEHLRTPGRVKKRFDGKLSTNEA